jgi:hypothetical protein
MAVIEGSVERVSRMVRLFGFGIIVWSKTNLRNLRAFLMPALNYFLIFQPPGCLSMGTS